MGFQGLLKFFFHHLYHSLAWSYDLVAWTVSLGRWKGWIEAIIPLLGEGEILELGYGPGHLQHRLRRSGLRVWGIDESRQMARLAGRNLRRAGFLSPRLVRGCAETLPFPSGQFDCLVATFPSPYIHRLETLCEARRVLKPGGRLVVLLGAWITGRSPAERGLALLYRVTGESPSAEQLPGALLERYAQAGLRASEQILELPGSRLLVISAVFHENAPN